MITFIKLTAYDDTPLYVRTDVIVSVFYDEDRDATAIQCWRPQGLHGVKETVEQVMYKLRLAGAEVGA